MEFTAHFCARNHYALDLPARDIGLAGVDQIRETLETPELSLDYITARIHFVRMDVRCAIPEEIARRSDLFTDRNQVEVTCPKEYLNRFAFRQVHTDRDPETGAIQLAWLSWELNVPEVLAHWEDQGFPMDIDDPPSDE